MSLDSVRQYSPLCIFLGLMLAPGQTLPDQPAVQSQGNDIEVAREEDPESRRIRRLGDVKAAEWEMDLSVPAPPANAEQHSGFDLPDPEQNAQLQNLLSTLATQPGNARALASLESFLDGLLDQAHELAEKGSLEEMDRLLGLIRNVNPRKKGLDQAFQRSRDLRNVANWLQAASDAMDAGNILIPEEGSALYFLGRVTSVDPNNKPVEEARLRAQRMLIEQALDSAKELDFENSERWLHEASMVREPQDLVKEAELQIAEYRARQVDEIQTSIEKAIGNRNFDLAEFTLIDLIALVGNDERVQQLRGQLGTARRYGKYEPGQVFRDQFLDSASSAPAVVVVRAGSFLMGSPPDERGRTDSESPQHRVTLERGFAIGIHEVTVGQFKEFIESRRHRTQADRVGKSRVYDEASGRTAEKERINWAYNYQGTRATNNEPVVHVDWHDAKAYVVWLSERTGESYRLPTEAEFEYVIRAGSVARYWWGDDRPQELVENLAGAEDVSASGRRWSSSFRRYDDGYWGPAPVGLYLPNPMGVHDLAGNVSEWVEDCWHQTYSLAPNDGSAWVNPGCRRRVVRGGYWASSPDQARSAARLSAESTLHGPRVGIRIARDL